MTNILERYGIKEVADVTFFETIKDADTGEIKEIPVLFLDTLKVSTIEETAEQVEARGGKGNAPLIIWDYGKEINLTIQDALYSPKSMALMHAQNIADSLKVATKDEEKTIYKYKNITLTKDMDITTDILNLDAAEKDSATIVNIYNGSEAVAKDSKITGTSGTAGNTYIVEYTVKAQTVTTIEVSANGFPGTYKVVGDTWARSKQTGKDQYFQFIIPQAKMSAEKTITLEAEGDPSVFDMNLRVLRPDDGKMMMLVQYEL